MGWGHPSLFGVLNGNGQLFVDCTFRIVPKPFYQCMIIMVYDAQTRVYVPVMYILLTSKTEDLYWHALHWVIVTAGCRLDPKIVSCDFEKALHNAVSNQFRSSSICGCLFHWKQALPRKMKEYKIDDEQIEMSMTKNCLGILTIIPQSEIKVKGIPFVRSCIPETEGRNKSKWNAFWKYFDRFWMSSPTFIKTWNIHHMDIDLLQNRTNNPLERYNRTLNSKFATAHPNLLSFVKALEIESRSQVKRLNDIRGGNAVAPELRGVTIPEIPPMYNNFVPPN